MDAIVDAIKSVGREFFLKICEYIKNNDDLTEEELINFIIKQINTPPLNDNTKNLLRELYEYKIESDYGEEVFEDVINDIERFEIEAEVLQELLFDTVNLYGLEYKYPKWSGYFLQAIDLSEIDFDGVVFDLELLSKLSGQEIKNTNDTDEIIYANTNANIISLTSEVRQPSLSKKDIADGKSFLFTKLSKLAEKIKNDDGFETWVETIYVEPNKCNFSYTNLDMEKPYDEINYENNNYSCTGITIVLPLDNKWNLSSRYKLIEAFQSNKLKGIKLKGIDGEIYYIDNEENEENEENTKINKRVLQSAELINAAVYTMRGNI